MSVALTRSVMSLGACSDSSQLVFGDDRELTMNMMILRTSSNGVGRPKEFNASRSSNASRPPAYPSCPKGHHRAGGCRVDEHCPRTTADLADAPERGPQAVAPSPDQHRPPPRRRARVAPLYRLESRPSVLALYPLPWWPCLWSGSWIAWQLPLHQIEATASNVRNLCYVIVRG